MRWSDLSQAPCPISRTLSILGDRWTLLIVRDCLLGIRRFDGFQERLPISRTLLANRLSKLVEDGILSRCLYQANPERYEYRLTKKGKALNGPMLMLADWGNRFGTDDGQPLVEHRHTSCNHKMTPRIVCDHCGEEATGASLQTVSLARQSSAIEGAKLA